MSEKNAHFSARAWNPYYWIRSKLEINCLKGWSWIAPVTIITSINAPTAVNPIKIASVACWNMAWAGLTSKGRSLNVNSPKWVLIVISSLDSASAANCKKLIRENQFWQNNVYNLILWKDLAQGVDIDAPPRSCLTQLKNQHISNLSIRLFNNNGSCCCRVICWLSYTCLLKTFQLFV